MIDDTIVAISTPIGESGIGIVRLSGSEAINIADKIVTLRSGKRISHLCSHTVHLGYVHNNNNGEYIDEVLIIVMHAPKTYTKEDVVEISCHGGSVVLNKILTLCLSHGARMATPGEFTKRAFINGRIDLIQAEAVCDLIRAKTAKAASISFQQLTGKLSNKIRALRDELVTLLSYIEVSLDYSEEDIHFITKKDILEKINSIQATIDYLLNSYQIGKLYRDGIKIVIAGKPNVGKSSLLNALLKEERAIVTPIAGTTRDAISEMFNLRGIPVVVIDTAGIRTHSTDLIEKMGIELARKYLQAADIVLFVCDITTEVSDEDKYIANLIRFAGTKCIIVANKIDLPNKFPIDNYLSLFPDKYPHVSISCLYLQGIDLLEEIIYALCTQGNTLGNPDMQETPVVSNIRHQQCLFEAKKVLSEALSNLHHSEEVIALYIKSAIDHLSQIIGEVTTEDILDTIFSQFCVGK